MPRIVRLGDAGSHGGTVITSASRRRCEGKLIARKSDSYACPTHGTNPITQGSAKWTCEGLPIARHGDLTACGATLISGAQKWSCS